MLERSRPSPLSLSIGFSHEHTQSFASVTQLRSCMHYSPRSEGVRLRLLHANRSRSLRFRLYMVVPPPKAERRTNAVAPRAFDRTELYVRYKEGPVDDLYTDRTDNERRCGKKYIDCLHFTILRRASSLPTAARALESARVNTGASGAEV